MYNSHFFRLWNDKLSGIGSSYVLFQSFATNLGCQSLGQRHHQMSRSLTDDMIWLLVSIVLFEIIDSGCSDTQVSGD